MASIIPETQEAEVVQAIIHQWAIVRVIVLNYYNWLLRPRCHIPLDSRALGRSHRETLTLHNCLLS